jgi:hypothetical protein
MGRVKQFHNPCHGSGTNGDKIATFSAARRGLAYAVKPRQAYGPIVIARRHQKSELVAKPTIDGSYTFLAVR